MFMTTQVVLAAWPWAAGLALKATKTIATSQGTKKAILHVVASNSTVKALARDAVFEGGKKKWAWHAVGQVAALFGATWLLYDATNWLQDLVNEVGANLWEGQQGTIPYTNGNYFHYRRAPTGMNHQDLLYEKLVIVRIWSGTSITIELVNNGSQERRIGSSNKVHVWQYKTTTSSAFPTDWTYSSNTAPYYAWQDAAVQIQYEGSYKPTPLNVAKNTIVVDTWVDNNPSKIAEPSPQVVNELPGDAIDLGETDGESVFEDLPVDPGTGEPYDPKTDEPLAPVTSDTGGIMTPPGFPGEPFFDSTITDVPEKMTIEEIMEEYEEREEPFKAWVDDINFSGSGVGQVSIQVPFGDKTAVLDFTQFDDIWNTLRTIIICFAYLYGVMIFFKGS